MSIPNRIQEITEEINLLSPNSSVDLMAVTKYYSLEQIEEVLKSPCRLFGESKVQNAIKKIEHFSDHNDIVWHLIGHLQRNKAKKAVRYFDCIQSVDSLRLCEKINEEAALINKNMPILLQINIAKEEGKYGFLPEELFDIGSGSLNDFLDQDTHLFTDVLHTIFSMPSIDIQGIMMIPPYDLDDREYYALYKTTKRCFELLRNYFNSGMTTLSMGMSGDYPIAIKEGATLVRLGRTLIS